MTEPVKKQSDTAKNLLFLCMLKKWWVQLRDCPLRHRSTDNKRLEINSEKVRILSGRNEKDVLKFN